MTKSLQLGYRQLAALLNVARRGTVFPAADATTFDRLRDRGLVDGEPFRTHLTASGAALARVLEAVARMPETQRQRLIQQCRLALGLVPESGVLADLLADSPEDRDPPPNSREDLGYG